MGNTSPQKKGSGRWKHLIICPNRTLFHGLTALLAEVTPGSTFTDLKAYPPRRPLTEAVGSERPTLGFLAVGTRWDYAVALIPTLTSVNAPMRVPPIVASP